MICFRIIGPMSACVVMHGLASAPAFAQGYDPSLVAYWTLDEVAIWSRALSASEIAAVHASGVAAVFGPDVVALVAFEARRDAGGAVTLTWVAAYEVSCGAFEVLRCARSGGAACAGAAVAVAIVGCRDDAAGGRYETRDGAPPAGTDLTYVLREHETTGGWRDYGPLHLDAAAGSARWEPGTGGGTAAPAEVHGWTHELSGGCRTTAAPAPVAALAALLALATARRRRPRAVFSTLKFETKDTGPRTKDSAARPRRRALVAAPRAAP
jgi:hypothetical protein